MYNIVWKKSGRDSCEKPGTAYIAGVICFLFFKRLNDHPVSRFPALRPQGIPGVSIQFTTRRRLHTTVKSQKPMKTATSLGERVAACVCRPRGGTTEKKKGAYVSDDDRLPPSRRRRDTRCFHCVRIPGTHSTTRRCLIHLRAAVRKYSAVTPAH